MSQTLSYILSIVAQNPSVKSLLVDYGDLSEPIEHKNTRSWAFTKPVSECDTSALLINVLSEDKISVHYILCNAPPLALNIQFEEVAKTKDNFSMASLLRSTLSTPCSIQVSRYDSVLVSQDEIEGQRQFAIAV